MICKHLYADVMDDRQIRCRACPMIWHLRGAWAKAACEANGLDAKKTTFTKIEPVMGATEAYRLNVPKED